MKGFETLRPLNGLNRLIFCDDKK